MRNKESTFPGLRSKNRPGTNFYLSVVGIHQKERIPVTIIKLTCVHLLCKSCRYLKK